MSLLGISVKGTCECSTSVQFTGELAPSTTIRNDIDSLTTKQICGTDEYGTTTEVMAAKEGLGPQELCDKCELHCARP